MLVLSYIPFVFMLVGILMYALCANPKLVKVGEILFFAGAVAFALGANGFGFSLGSGVNRR